MNKPQMIIFDYGQTLVDEGQFDGLKGTEGVITKAAKNPEEISYQEIQSLAEELNQELGRFSGIRLEEQTIIEVHNHLFQNYLYEYLGIELSKSPQEVERIFWDAATSPVPTEGIAEFLEFLDQKEIRTAVISNISFSGKALYDRINRLIPSNKFEFIIATSEYVFRKPHKRIYELALRKANLEAADVWYCGDNAYCDVDGAAACGIYPVWYKGAIRERKKDIPVNDHLTINNWQELINLLEGNALNGHKII